MADSKFVLTFYAEDNTITTLECDQIGTGDPIRGHASMVAVVRGQEGAADALTTIPAVAFIGFGWEQEGS